MGCSPGAERRKGALAGHARHGFRVFGLQGEERDVQQSDAGDSAEARAGLDDKTLEVFLLVSPVFVTDSNPDPVDHRSAYFILCK